MVSTMDASGIDALLRAKEVLGGTEQALADVVGRAQPTVHGVLKRGKSVPAEWCPKIEEATTAKGKPVTRSQLRPDLWPAEEGAPQ